MPTVQHGLIALGCFIAACGLFAFGHLYGADGAMFTSVSAVLMAGGVYVLGFSHGTQTPMANPVKK